MNREIEFRGYNPKNGKWLYGYYLVNRGKHYIAPDGIQPPSATPEDFEVEPESIGQYTNMRDKDGEKIYEGDILINEGCCPYGSVSYVKYGKMYAGYIHVFPRYEIQAELIPLHLEDIEYYGMFIGGNIYENPEFLQNKEEDE